MQVIFIDDELSRAHPISYLLRDMDGLLEHTSDHGLADGGGEFKPLDIHINSKAKIFDDLRLRCIVNRSRCV